MEGPLSGVRILALENYLAGPVATMVLGDLGAEGIKIEPPQGDGSRMTIGPNHRGESAHFLAWNRDKKGIVLDLRTKTGRQAFFDLVKIADVVLSNFRAGAMDRLGFGHEALKKINPNIITINLTGMGESGPYRDRSANDHTVSGISGILSVTGEPGGRPVRPGPAVCDLSGAFYGVIATISALYEREKKGAGQSMDVALLAGAVSLMGYHIAYYTCSGEIPQPLGTGYFHTAPIGAYKTKNNYIVLGPCWPRITRVLGAEWLMDDPRFATYEARIKNRFELDKEVEKYFQKATTEEWLEILYAEDIMAAPLNTVDKTLADPQVNHLGMIIDIEHALGGTLRLAGNPIKGQSIKGKHLPPPVLGQHTDEVLRDVLGYAEARIKKLKAEQEANAAETKAHVRKEK